MKNNNLTLTIAGETIHFDTALIAGRLTDGNHTALYGGNLDLDDLHLLLYSNARAVIKIILDEFEAPFEEVDRFVVSAITEAMTKEWNNYNSGESDVDIHKIRKSF